jgi:hypothetical protein
MPLCDSSGGIDLVGVAQCIDELLQLLVADTEFPSGVKRFGCAIGT